MSCDPVIDSPDVKRDVTAAFEAYERAFMANDVEALNGFFWNDSRATRYGIADKQLGHDAIAAFRANAPAPDYTRELHELRITTFGTDVAVAQVEFTRSDTTLRGLQSQVWVRMADGWKIVAAHVSLIDSLC